MSAVDEETAQQLVAVGGGAFDVGAAMDALQHFGGEVDAALLHLLGDGEGSSPRQAGQPAVKSISSDSESFDGFGSDGEAFEDGSEDESGSSQEAPLVVVAPDALEESYWAELPPDVMQVLGRWLAVHLGRLVDRHTVPDYLHPLRTQAELNEHGRQRVSATLSMLKAIQACRQTCRIWRDEIPYGKVTELGLDGVAIVGAVPRVHSERPPPSCGAPVRASTFRDHDAGNTFSPTSPMLWTWWPGGRVLRPLDWYQRHPRQLDFPPGTVPTERCPACRTPIPYVLHGKTVNIALCNFLEMCGLTYWYKNLHIDCQISTIAKLRQCTEHDLLSKLQGT